MEEEQHTHDHAQHQHGQQPGMHPSFLRVIQQKQRIKQKLAKVKHRIGVYSAKGGVGKTTVAINLAYSLMKKGFKVGLLDADIDCPNVTVFLGMEDTKMEPVMPLKPIEKEGVKVASTAMLVDELKRPIIWRGPLVAKMVADFLENTDWGELDYLVIDLPPGCLPEGTPILMADNTLKSIEKVNTGDYVYSFDGAKLVKNRVVASIPQGKHQVFSIETPKRKIQATGNHPFLKYTGINHFSWRPLTQLKVKDRLIVINCVADGSPLKLPKFDESKHNTNTKVRLPEFTDTKLMQIIGHFVGDGFVRINKKRNLTIGLRICEPQNSKFRVKYENLYKDVFGANVFSDGTKTFAVDSRPLVELFQSLDLDHKALEKQVPSWVFSLPLDQRLAFLKGYSEADGHIRHRELVKELPGYNGQLRLVKMIQDCVSIESPNEILVRQLQQLCQISGVRSCNVSGRIKKKHAYILGRKIKRSVSYTFQYSLKFNRSDFKLETIRAIEPVDQMETYDLQLEGLHNFVANNMVVHNTSDAPLSIMQLLDLDGFVIVTNPQRIAALNSIRSGMMAKRMNAPLIGVVENMSNGKPSDKTMEVVKALDTVFLGTVERDEAMAKMTDTGKIHVLEDKKVGKAFDSIVDKITGK